MQMNWLLPGLLSLALLAGRGAWAATVTYDWAITWVSAAPDGFTRPVIGVNGVWPCPMIVASAGDTIVINLTNQLGNETTGLHFHGIAQYGTPEMDGPVGATQCAVPPGLSVQYAFVVSAPGTYWYHSHVMGQYPDGLRGPLIVNDPEDPYTGQVDEEVVWTISDWYHEQNIPLAQAMLQPSNRDFSPPLPDSIIVNEGGSTRVAVEQGKTYRFRLINFSALASAMIDFQSHDVRVIMQDGSYVQAVAAQQLRLAPAQRYDVLLTPSAQGGDNPFLVSLDTNADYTNPDADASGITWNYNETGYLVLGPPSQGGGGPLAPPSSVDVVHAWAPFEEAAFQNPYGDGPLEPVGQVVQLDFSFCFNTYGIPQACFNGQPYVDQLVPTLYSAATTGADNTNPVVYGGVNPVVLEEAGVVVELVVNNLDVAAHPFHLHGHQFQVLVRGPNGAGRWPGWSSSPTPPPQFPASKDVVTIQGASYAVLRFRADNPGVWLFHCHIEWHVEMGLTATFIETPARLRNLTFPADQLEACRVQGIPTAGNAAGNTVNVTDTAGMRYVNPPVYTGALYEPTATLAPNSTRFLRRWQR